MSFLAIRQMLLEGLLGGLASRAHVSDDHGLMLTPPDGYALLVNSTTETRGRALHGHHYPRFTYSRRRWQLSPPAL
jgi:hypothetical protein